MMTLIGWAWEAAAVVFLLYAAWVTSSPLRRTEGSDDE